VRTLKDPRAWSAPGVRYVGRCSRGDGQSFVTSLCAGCGGGGCIGRSGCRVRWGRAGCLGGSRVGSGAVVVVSLERSVGAMRRSDRCAGEPGPFLELVQPEPFSFVVDQVDQRFGASLDELDRDEV
jgi:hypothetical protein